MLAQPAEPEEDAEVETKSSWLGRIVVLVVVGLIALAVGYAFQQNLISLASLAARETQIREFYVANPGPTWAGAYLLYTAITGLSLPGAAVTTLLYGWFFDFFTAVVIVSFASTSGAMIAFLLSRYLLRDWIQNRFGERLERFNRALEREGGFYLFTLRLIPAVPFVVINVVMALTPIKARTFWWVSQLGMLPGTCVFVYAGSTLPGPREIVEKGAGGILTPQLFIAFTLLGIFPLLVKKLFHWFGKTPA